MTKVNKDQKDLKDHKGNKVSLAGGVAHNVGQLLLAALVLGARAVAWYAPVLLVAGLITGGLIGGLCRLLLPRLTRLFR